MSRTSCASSTFRTDAKRPQSHTASPRRSAPALCALVATPTTIVIPRISRRKPPEAPTRTRQSPQGQGLKGLLFPVIPADSRSARQRQDRPVTTEVAGPSPVAPALRGCAAFRRRHPRAALASLLDAPRARRDDEWRADSWAKLTVVSRGNVALPSIQQRLGASLTGLQWVVDAYAVTLAALILMAGALADRYGRRLVFASGVVVFSVASFLCGAAWNVATLDVARALQGAGALGTGILGTIAVWGSTVGLA